MPALSFPPSHTWSCIPNQTSGPPPPLYGVGLLPSPPDLCLGLLAAHVAVIVWLLGRNLLLPRLQWLPREANQIREPPSGHITSIFDAAQVVAAVEAFHADILRAITPLVPAGSGRHAFDSDGDSGGSDDERGYPPGSGSGTRFSYPPIHFLDAGDFRIVVPRAIDQLQEVIRELPDAETRRRAFVGAQETGGFYRLSDVAGSTWILDADAEAFVDPCELTQEATKIWVMKLKINTKLICLVWCELDGPHWQLSQELKNEYFVEVVRQSAEKLLQIARSFTLIDPEWSAHHISPVLTIFGALVDVLGNMRNLPLNRCDEVDGIFDNMVNTFEGILRANNSDSSEESTNHPANSALIETLKFFHLNRDMPQSVLATANPCSHIVNCWVSKLKEDAERMFRDDVVQRCLFLLNNTCYVRQNMSLPSLFSNTELMTRLDSMIEEYKRNYLDVCWVPLMMSYLVGHSLNNPRTSSLDKFTADFVAIYDCQKTMKVAAEHRYRLREAIVNEIVPQYESFLTALRENPSRVPEMLYLVKRVMVGKKVHKKYTVEGLTEMITNLFEGEVSS